MLHFWLPLALRLRKKAIARSNSDSNDIKAHGDVHICFTELPRSWVNYVHAQTVDTRLSVESLGMRLYMYMYSICTCTCIVHCTCTSYTHVHVCSGPSTCMCNVKSTWPRVCNSYINYTWLYGQHFGLIMSQYIRLLLVLDYHTFGLVTMSSSSSSLYSRLLGSLPAPGFCDCPLHLRLWWCLRRRFHRLETSVPGMPFFTAQAIQCVYIVNNHCV